MIIIKKKIKLEERFTLCERIYEIQNEAELCAPYASYVTMVASFLSEITDTWNCVATGQQIILHGVIRTIMQLNHSLYADILPEHYAESYANPDYAFNVFGLEMGQLLCALYAEIRGCIAYVLKVYLQQRAWRVELFFGSIISILEQRTLRIRNSSCTILLLL